MKENQLRLLRAKILLKGYIIKDFAKASGMSLQAFYNKVNGVTEFNRSEIKNMSNVLELTLEEKEEIFF